ncbi:glucosaminidase domain-containing protein [Dokdonia ponticola]|uniref:Peptidoglycan hydrolase n=1 Tax=Dokdonia ponticola TaxID=2041041 RepID=A0ABV9HX75_9FLAO
MIRRIVFIFLLGCVLASCGSSKRTTTRKTTPKKERNERVTPRPTTETPKEEEIVVNPVPKTGVEGYIEAYAGIAQEEMRQYGIPASITLAQGILESGAGNGELVQKANNHFGIKCHDWKGAKVYHDDDEKGECFRKYSLAKFSYRDHSLFLTNRGRYASLFKLPKDDYKGWAKGLRAAGYATDKKYPVKLISLIERYELYRYDGEVLGKQEKDYKIVKDKKNQHTVEKGETLYRISKKYKISVEDLKKINGLESNEIFVGQVLYVEPFDSRY